jgi:hypothetical protein
LAEKPSLLLHPHLLQPRLFQDLLRRLHQHPPNRKKLHPLRLLMHKRLANQFWAHQFLAFLQASPPQLRK